MLIAAVLIVAAGTVAVVMLRPRAADTPVAATDLADAAAAVPEIALNPGVMPLSREEAERINELRQPDLVEVTAAKAFAVGEQWRADPRFFSALDCLTQAIYYEAASEPDSGQRGVAQVVLNRVRHPAFPNTVCGVVYQGSNLPTGCQFTFTCDGSLIRQPSRSGWARARRVALSALSGWVEAPVGLSTHYHADYVVPYWASSLRKVKTVGRHIFYAFGGRGGAAGAFAANYDFAGELPPIVASLEAQPLDLGAEAALTLPDQPNALFADDLADRSTPQADTARPLGDETPQLRADQRAGELQVRGADSRLIVD
jgi:spore germination cell wall hydrolase CwlJ-like protein